MATATPDPRRWKALILVCAAIFVVVLDIAIVNVALPSIGRDLHFAEKNLQWVITAYALTYGGFLLLGGRAADLLGRRLVFMGGLALFTVASLLCGLSTSSEMLIIARGVQGLGAAIVSPAALSIISTTFTEGSERNKALGAWGAVGGSGAAAGVLFGGILTEYLSWEWIFFVNVPVGVIVLLLTPLYVRESRREDVVHDYDPLGALLVTSGLIVLVYAISEAPDVGWGAFRTIGLLVLAGLLLASFLFWEWRERAPLMPLGIFRIRLVSAANWVAFLHSGGLYGSFLLLTLYMQQVLRLSVIETGLAFLATAGTAVLFAAPAQALSTRIGVKPVMLTGIGLLVAGALWYTQIDPDGSYPVDLLPGFLAVGVGIPFSYIPITITALAGVSDEEAGLASGLLNTSQQVGGAIGTAVLSTVAFTHFDTLLGEGKPPDIALTDGFRWSFWVCFAIWLAALVSAAILIRREEVSAEAAEAAVS
ncbi:MAG TPA: MFS transporter [Gaiellaceae bacterium]|nr:MFS transporter [Gaiellaceae bacterium]